MIAFFELDLNRIARNSRDYPWPAPGGCGRCQHPKLWGLTGDRFLGDVVSLLPNPFELEARPVKAWIGTQTCPSHPESCHGTRKDMCFFGYFLIPQSHSASSIMTFKS
jgi:hypothetical protein